MKCSIYWEPVTGTHLARWHRVTVHEGGAFDYNVCDAKGFEIAPKPADLEDAARTVHWKLGRSLAAEFRIFLSFALPWLRTGGIS